MMDSRVMGMKLILEINFFILFYTFLNPGFHRVREEMGKLPAPVT